MFSSPKCSDVDLNINNKNKIQRTNSLNYAYFSTRSGDCAYIQNKFTGSCPSVAVIGVYSTDVFLRAYFFRLISHNDLNEPKF